MRKITLKNQNFASDVLHIVTRHRKSSNVIVRLIEHFSRIIKIGKKDKSSITVNRKKRAIRAKTNTPVEQNVDTRHVWQQHVRVDQTARTDAVSDRAHVREAVGRHGLGFFVAITDVEPDAVTRQLAVGLATPIRHDFFER